MFRIAVLLFVMISSAYGQSVDSLSTLAKLIQKGKTDSIRFAANDVFTNGIEKLLHQQNGLTIIRDSLKSISVTTPEDNQFSLITWVLPHYEGDQYDYFGYLQIRNEKSDTLIRLDDSTAVIKKPESEKLQPGKWLGAVYYSIIPVLYKKKTYYTLLGWKANNNQITQKIIDVIYFEGKKTKFGYPLFKAGSVYKNRIVFSYNAHASMTLHYEKEYDGIVFDHIGGQKDAPATISGPDGTYDGFKLKKGKWILYNDIEVGTKWAPKKELPVPSDKE